MVAAVVEGVRLRAGRVPGPGPGYLRRGAQLATLVFFVEAMMLQAFGGPLLKNAGEKSIHTVLQHFQFASRRSLSMIARTTLFDAENVFRLLPVGVPRSMEENVPQKNHFRLLSDNRQRGLKCRRRRKGHPTWLKKKGTHENKKRMYGTLRFFQRGNSHVST